MDAANEQIGDSIRKKRSRVGSVFKIILSLFRTKHTKPHGICGDNCSSVKNRSLPASTLIDILKVKTGKDDIDERNLIPTLYDIFGEDACPTVKNIAKFGCDSLQHRGGDSGVHGEISGMVGKQEAYSRSTRSNIPGRGILLHASQSDEEAAEIKSLNQQLIDLVKMEALVTGPAEVGKLEEEMEGLEVEIEVIKQKQEQSVDESFINALEHNKPPQ